MRTAPAALGLVLLAGRASAQDAAPAAPPVRDAEPAPAAPAAATRLKLGPYRSAAADDPMALVDQPRFQEHVEVHGRVMDSKYLTARLEWWLKDFDPTRGPTPSSLSAPSIQEMRAYRPHPPDAINLLPIMQWVTDKLSGKKGDK